MNFHILIKHIHDLIVFIQAHPNWGMACAFLIAFIESLPVFGTIVPGSITMTAVGTLIGSHTLPGTSTIIWASIGAFCGDLLGYITGRFYKDQVRKVWPFKKYPKWLDAGEAFIEKHGGKSIIIGRFFGPMRSMVPMVAGMLNMNRWRFVAAAIPTAIMWALLYTVPGILLGTIALELPPAKATEFLIFGGLVIVTLWALFWIIQRIIMLICRFLSRVSYRIWQFFHRHRLTNPLAKLIERNDYQYDHHQFTLACLSLLFFILFLFIFSSVVCQSYITYLNDTVYYLLQTFRSPILTNAAMAITFIGDKVIALIAALLIIICFFLQKHRRTALYLFILTILTTLAIGFFKHVFYSPRPTGLAYVDTSSSFPSGHTTLSIVLLSFYAFLIAERVKKSQQWIVYTISTLLVLAVAFSRLYLGAHWLSDILGSFTLGLAVLLAVILFYRKKPYEILPIKQLSITLVICMILPWAIWGCNHFNNYKSGYKHYWPKQVITTSQWWNAPATYLPTYRLNRLGRPIQPFNVEWNGSIETIQKVLLKKGWKVVPKKNVLQNLAFRFDNQKTENYMPLLPLLYRDYKPTLILIKVLPKTNTILELYLWPTDTTLKDNAQPLWIGLVKYQIAPNHIWDMKPRFILQFQKQEALNFLLKDIRGLKKKVIYIAPNVSNKHLQKLDWDGRIVLIKSY